MTSKVLIVVIIVVIVVVVVVCCRSTVGYEFPPVMSKMIEANVQRMWQKWKERG